MPSTYRVTLRSASFTKRGRTYSKGFTTLVTEGTPDYYFYKNSAFKWEPATTFDLGGENAALKPPPPKEKPKPEPEPEPDDQPVEETTETPVERLVEWGIPKKVVAGLKAAGLDTAEKILSDDVEFEELTAIDGVGENTANRIIDACEDLKK